MSYVPAARPDTFTALGLPLAVSRYPRIIRLLPATSAMGVLQTLSEVQLTVAPVAAPVSSSRLSGEELFAPAASFQFAFATTPADSELAIAVPLPTKSALIAAPVAANAGADDAPPTKRNSGSEDFDIANLTGQRISRLSYERVPRRNNFRFTSGQNSSN